MTAATANFHDVNATDNTNTKDKASKKKFSFFGGERKERSLGWWGATWRFTLVMAIYVAALIAIVFGMQYAVAYIGGLGLATIWANVWSAVVVALCYIVTIIGSFWTGTVIGNIIVDYYSTKAAE